MIFTNIYNKTYLELFKALPQLFKQYFLCLVEDGIVDFDTDKLISICNVKVRSVYQNIVRL